MELHNLRPAVGAVKDRKRIGRGGARGGTSGKGHNGAQARSGYSSKRGFEGGQMPLKKRVPYVYGFKSYNRVVYKAVNLDLVQNLVDKIGVVEVTRDLFIKNGIIGKNDLYKILANGEIKGKIKIYAHAISVSAKKKIENVGGAVELINIYE
jgi:large subunit ribosomal protein L15